MVYSEFFRALNSSKLWLPRNISWEDVYDRGDRRYPDVMMLWNKLFPAIVIALVVRHILIRYVFSKWGIRSKISSTRAEKAPYCRPLEKWYAKKGINAPRDAGLKKRMSEETGLTQENVYNWFKIRRLQDEVSDLDKFTEDCWMVFYLTAMSCFGCYALMDEPWFFGLNHYWENYPFNNFDETHEWFYVAGMTLFATDAFVLTVKKYEKSDLGLRVYHHVAGFLLMAVSWISNEVRTGAIFLFMIESGSPFAYMAKMCEWHSCTKMSQFFYVIFITHWLIVRILWFHFWYLPCTVVVRHAWIGFIPAYIAADLLIALLTVTNFLWTKIIFSQIYKAISIGNPVCSKRGICQNTLNELTDALSAANKRNN